MKLGVSMILSDETIDPRDLAQAAEQHGFESLFVADHTHIPVDRQTPYPQPPFGDLPREYYRVIDPMVALTAMASVTSTLQLGTGVCLVVERDPIVLAKQVASVDHLSGGRVLLGVGAGWNLEEMRNHGTNPKTRMRLLRERVEAMREIWTQDQAEYHGDLVSFDPIYSWPKPARDPHPPVLVGGNGPTVLDRVIGFGDGWFPGHQRDLGALGARIDELRERTEAEGCGPRSVTIALARSDALERYAEIGAERAVFLLPSHDAPRALADLAACAEAVGLGPSHPRGGAG